MGRPARHRETLKRALQSIQPHLDEITKLYEIGMTPGAIAAKLGVSKSGIWFMPKSDETKQRHAKAAYHDPITTEKRLAKWQARYANQKLDPQWLHVKSRKRINTYQINKTPRQSLYKLFYNVKHVGRWPNVDLDLQFLVDLY